MYWYQVAAGRGHPMAQYKVGVDLIGSVDQVRNEKAGIEWLEKAAKQGNGLAMAFLASRWAKPGLREGTVEGAKPLRQDSRVLDFSAEAAKLGVPSAQRLLASFYESGEAGEKDYGAAIRWYREAAMRGDNTAGLFLARLLDKGPKSFQNPTEASQWYAKASAAGIPEADLWLGQLYEEGRGIKRDERKAFRHYQIAAEEGMEEAIYRSAMLYDQGKGVERDTRKARDLFAVAADKGHKGAKDFLDRVMKSSDREVDPFNPFKFGKF